MLREEKAKEEKVEKEERAEGSILPRAEDGGADADDGGTVTDGQGPVVGHSDGELGEVGQLGITGVQTLLEGLDAGEIPSGRGCGRADRNGRQHIHQGWIQFLAR